METFPEFLRRVGEDYAESGFGATSEDYADAASRIEDAALECSEAAADLAGEGNEKAAERLRGIATALLSRED